MAVEVGLDIPALAVGPQIVMFAMDIAGQVAVVAALCMVDKAATGPPRPEILLPGANRYCRKNTIDRFLPQPPSTVRRHPEITRFQTVPHPARLMPEPGQVHTHGIGCNFVEVCKIEVGCNLK